MISVVIPIYNSAKYLDKCIKSILSQTYTNIELILINDGSTDNSGNICDKYVSMDTRVRYYSTGNNGVSIARNIGIELAKGDYIAFYDSDDFLKEKDSLERLYIYAKRYDVDVIKSDYATYDDTGYWTFPLQHNKKIAEKKLTPEEFISEIVEKESFLWTLLIKREIIGNVRFTRGRVYLEDMEFIYRLAQNMHSAIYIPLRHYVYRKHPEAISYSVNPQKIADIIEVMYSLLGSLSSVDDDLKTLYLQKGIKLYISALRMIAIGGFFSNRKILVKEMNIEKHRQYVLDAVKSYKKNINLYLFIPPYNAITLLYIGNVIKTMFYLYSYKIQRTLGIYK